MGARRQLDRAEVRSEFEFEPGSMIVSASECTDSPSSMYSASAEPRTAEGASEGGSAESGSDSGEGDASPSEEG